MLVTSAKSRHAGSSAKSRAELSCQLLRELPTGESRMLAQRCDNRTELAARQQRFQALRQVGRLEGRPLDEIELICRAAA